MSRHYGRGYHRRGTPVCQTSFPIDKLFKENSNRPSAARSAGTIGKWGITSFTTIRSSSYEPSRSKYSSFHRNHNQNINNGGNPYSNDENKAKQDGPPKPKKFFKSRNAEVATEETTVSPPSASTRGDPPSRSPVKKCKEDTGTTSKKVYGSKTPPKSDQAANDEYKPPIVLRIFKGTSCIVADGEKVSSPVTSPTSPKARTSPSKQEKAVAKQEKPATSTRSTRRRSFQEATETAPVSPRPKRARKEQVKDPAIQTIISQLISDDEGETAFKTCDIAPLNIGSVEKGLSEPVDDASDDNVTLASTSYYLKKDSSHLDVKKELERHDKQEDVENIEKIEEVKKLLEESTDTFGSVVDKILQNPIEKCKNVSEDVKEAPAPAPAESEAQNDEKEFESGSDSSDAINPCGMTLTSKVESGGLKLVIKKTPETVVEKESVQEPTLEKEGDSAPVKVLPVKKKSIFKSRGKDEGGNGNSKRLALYKHNWNTSQAVEESNKQTTPSSASQYDDINDFDLGGLTRVSSEQSEGNKSFEDITKVKCDRKDKGYYTVVRNVKKAHQIQESGEFQEFNDDVDYILDALKDNNPVGTRCLSAITLAGKCMAPAFRMHVRAHGTVAKFFKALHDATTDQSLGLCTATVMFVLSQDRLNMDLDRDSLELMLNLLESDASHKNALDDCGMSSAQLRKNKQKVRELCAEIQNKGLAKHLNLDNITVGQLAMETLLSLTSKRAGEWFKEELRELGGLEHIVKTISDCSKSLETYISQWTDHLLDRLRKIDRCLRVLENVTSQNEENQVYLLKYQDGILLSTIIKLYKICNDEISLYPCTDPTDKVSTGYVIREALLATLKVLINLTQDYNKKLFCDCLVTRRVGLIESSLHLLLQVPNYIPDEEKFDMIILDLNLLINLVENNEDNRNILMESKAPPDPECVVERSAREQMSAIAALVNLFYIHEKSAYEEQVETDAILDGKKDVNESNEQTSQSSQSAPPKSKGDEIEETVAKLLQKAGNHMEHTFIGAYIVLLIGYLITENKGHEATVRQHLPQGNFSSFIAVLEKFFNFMKMTATAVGGQSNKATERVLNYYIEIEKPPKVEPKDEDLDLKSSPLYDGVLDYTMS
ncbi:hypothetical protein RUM44_009098 [Polyplax serrata]|uniref:WAPL domain-containing protein n=1 Tax=Polyplax serrata TaxID=468196 RepID=A0ABR1ARQ5_POLSC